MVARELAEKLHVAADLVRRINQRLDEVRTGQGIGVSLRWRRRDGLDADVITMVDLLSKPPDLRTTEQDGVLRTALSARLDQARADDPEAAYRDLIGRVLDYRAWHEITLLLRRPGRCDERLTRRTALSEGEKKIVSYLPLFAAVAASCDSLAETAADAPRFLLLDDAFAKVSEDNHPKLFGLLVQLELDFIVTSERLWGTHSTVPELAITEVIRDAALGVIVLEHSRWNGTTRTESNLIDPNTSTAATAPRRRVPNAGGPRGGRLLFRYITGDEWEQYRPIMAVFAGTFFSDFTTDEVQQRLGLRDGARRGHHRRAVRKPAPLGQSHRLVGDGHAEQPAGLLQAKEPLLDHPSRAGRPRGGRRCPGPRRRGPRRVHWAAAIVAQRAAVLGRYRSRHV